MRGIPEKYIHQIKKENMKKTLMMMVAVMGLFLLGSCDQKGRAIERLEQYTYELETNGSKYDKQQWEKSKQEYKDIRAQLDGMELTESEQRTVSDLKQRIAMTIAKTKFTDTFKELGDLGNYLKSATSGLIQQLGNTTLDLEQTLGSTMADLLSGLGIGSGASDSLGVMAGELKEGLDSMKQSMKKEFDKAKQELEQALGNAFKSEKTE